MQSSNLQYMYIVIQAAFKSCDIANTHDINCREIN